MSDIAKALSISSISVSRALAGQEGVSKELRDRVLLKAHEMGYFKRKNLADYRILVLHQKPFIQDSSSYSHMIQGIEMALQTVGCDYSVEFMDKTRQERLELPSNLVKSAGFDGIIYVGGFQNGYVGFLQSAIRHHVFYAGYSPSFECDSVVNNFNNCGYRQAEYLIQKGHREICFIGSHNDYINKEKVLGIISALEDFNVPVHNDRFIYTTEDINNQILTLLHSGINPTAIICQWDYTALRLIKLLYEAGLRVPEDISVIGSGNTDMSQLSIPALTTMDLNIDYACECTVELLLRRIEKPDKPFENILINGTFVERNSVRRLEV